MYVFTCMIDFVGVVWAWSSLSELLAYPNGSRFPLGQRGSDNRGWTVIRTSTVLQNCLIFNPRRMREGYGSRSVCVCVCVCVSVITPAATYLVNTMQTRCH